MESSLQEDIIGGRVLKKVTETTTPHAVSAKATD